MLDYKIQGIETMYRALSSIDLNMGWAGIGSLGKRIFPFSFESWVNLLDFSLV
jgi:hypothetical protein